MATLAFKSTTRRHPIGASSLSTDDSHASSSSKSHCCSTKIQSGKDNCSELDDESVSSRSIHRDRVKCEANTASFSQWHSRSVSRNLNGANSGISGGDGVNSSSQRRGRSDKRTKLF